MIQPIIDPIIPPTNGGDIESTLLNGGDPPSATTELAAKAAEDRMTRETNPITSAVAPPSFSLEELKPSSRP